MRMRMRMRSMDDDGDGGDGGHFAPPNQSMYEPWSTAQQAPKTHPHISNTLSNLANPKKKAKKA